MTTPLLLLACGVTAIRRHPGPDDKVEILSDAITRARKRMGSKVVSSRFEKLLQEWEGSSWSASNYTQIVVEIENELIQSIDSQHGGEQESIDRAMNELVCKDILVNNAHSAATSSDTECNDAVNIEKAAAQVLAKSITKLKNLDLIRQRSLNKKIEPSYSYPGTLGDNLNSFDCKLDVSDTTNSDNCDNSLSEYQNLAEQDVENVKADLELEKSTWVGFKNEEEQLQIEQDTAVQAAQSSYSHWVEKNEETRDAWRLRASHVCLRESVKSVGYYGLSTYEDDRGGVLAGQTCTKNAAVPISFQAQHTDYCFLDNSLTKTKTRLTTANNSGSQVDQQYELQVLNTILCILKRLDISDSNLTDTDVGILVETCESSQVNLEYKDYTFTSKENLNCKDKELVSYTTPSLADEANDENWCFSNFNVEFTKAGVSTDSQTLTDLIAGTNANPACLDVVAGAPTTTFFSEKMAFRWREEISAPGASHPLTSADSWKDVGKVYFGEDGDQPKMQTGKGFLLDTTQVSYKVWATDCAWADSIASAKTGWESKLTTESDKLCALPQLEEYLEAGFEVKYIVKGDHYHHRGDDIMTQCDPRS